MNLLKQSLETAGEVDYLIIILNLFFCIISSFILMYVYRNKSNALSSKIQISPIIPLLSNITFLVILVVKSSLALSLGLVGALSVIRFRTPVKEPEDLAFLFFAIALGIGYGAFQLYATSIIFVILIVIIWFFLSNKNENITDSFNIVVELGSEKNPKYFDKILKLLNLNCREVNLVKIEKETNITIIYYRVTFENADNIKNLMDILDKEFNEIKFSLYENKILN
ncbi:MAG: DUF4956 domain-containing protein [Pelagibacterales bacterium]|nr:DUF4956 domain-containing protein [Pelagibacterales bacterium]